MSSDVMKHPKASTMKEKQMAMSKATGLPCYCLRCTILPIINVLQFYGVEILDDDACTAGTAVRKKTRLYTCYRYFTYSVFIIPSVVLTFLLLDPGDEIAEMFCDLPQLWRDDESSVYRTVMFVLVLFSGSIALTFYRERSGDFMEILCELWKGVNIKERISARTTRFMLDLQSYLMVFVVVWYTIITLFLSVSYVIFRRKSVNRALSTGDLMCSLYVNTIVIFEYGILAFGMAFIVVLFMALRLKMKEIYDKMKREMPANFSDCLPRLKFYLDLISKMMKTADSLISQTVVYTIFGILALQFTMLFLALYQTLEQRFLKFFFLLLSVLLTVPLLGILFLAATLQSEAHKWYYLVYRLYFMRLSFDDEVQAFTLIQNLSKRRVGISCMGFFIFTKTSILKLVGASMTQILVIVQLSTDSWRKSCNKTNLTSIVLEERLLQDDEIIN